MTKRLIATGRALEQALAQRAPVRIDDAEAVPAAVLMPLWDKNHEVQVVFTKRNALLPHHAGQVSFPGGARDPEDCNMMDTALRETNEEIGVRPEQISVVARLDQVHTTTSNFVITPFVGLLENDVAFELSPLEVERLVFVPLAKVLDAANYRLTEVRTRTGVLFDSALCHHGDIIWGATARILLNLLESLGPEAAKVAVLGQHG